MPAERRPGMDHGHYAWSPLPIRTPLRWPGDAAVSVSVVVALEYLELEPPPDTRTAANLSGGLGPRPYPNYALLSHREYGHRVGVFRILDALEAHDFPVTVALDVGTAEEYPWLVRHCLDRGAEIVAHGISVSRMISSEMSLADERAYVHDTLERLFAATGIRPSGWWGPEYGESEHTPAVLAEAGLRYVLDWCNDEQPYAMTVPSARLTVVPMMVEYDDAFALWTRRMTHGDWSRMVREGFDRLRVDGATSSRTLAFVVRPWLIGQPFRIAAFESALAHIASAHDVWKAKTGEVAEAFEAVSVA